MLALIALDQPSKALTSGIIALALAPLRPSSALIDPILLLWREFPDLALAQALGPKPAASQAALAFLRESIALVKSAADQQSTTATILVLAPGSHVISAWHPRKALIGVACPVKIAAAVADTKQIRYVSATELPSSARTRLTSHIGIGHAVMQMSGSVCIRNIELFGVFHVQGRKRAAIAVGMAAAHADLEGCLFTNLPDVGLLVARGSARVTDCVFDRIAMQAIEVRESGQLTARNTSITRSRQGVSAYGGARLVELHGCHIGACAQEGVIAAGCSPTANTTLQRQLFKKGDSNRKAETLHERTSREACEWARMQDDSVQLRLIVSACQVVGNGCFGVSVDCGARAVVHSSLISSNVPHNVFIKGGSDAFLVANQVGSLFLSHFFPLTLASPAFPILFSLFSSTLLYSSLCWQPSSNRANSPRSGGRASSVRSRLESTTPV